MKFEIDENNVEKLNKWLQQHILDCSYWDPASIISNGGIDGAITYAFTPTNKGLRTEIICRCGQKSDITDYEQRKV